LHSRPDRRRYLHVFKGLSIARFSPTVAVTVGEVKRNPERLDMTKRKTKLRRRAFGLQETADIFGISRESTKRFARLGVLKTITVGGRRLVPVAEIERIEREGLGNPRKGSTPRSA
jgi:hypothetical protein